MKTSIIYVLRVKPYMLPSSALKLLKHLTFLLSLPLICISHSMAQPVTLKNKTFYVGNEKFYPMALNYGLSLLFNGNDFYLSPYRYYITENFECNSSSTCSQQLQTDFNYMAGMGFNTLRISGFRPRYSQELGLHFLYTHNTTNKNYFLPINPSNNSDPGMHTILNLYDKILELANATSPHPLKIIYLMKGDTSQLNTTEVNLWSEFYEVIASHIKNSAHINAFFAYDVMNEPAYHITSKKTKQEACEIISTWYDIIKGKDQRQLVTIGNCGRNDIFSFDPSILKVDFNSLHYYPPYRPYEDRANSQIQELARKRTENELYWFNQASIVPWIIGETGFTATCDNNWGISNGLDGTLTDQGNFAIHSLQASCNCGASGYSWWQYQDYKYPNNYNAPGDFLGLLERGGAPTPFMEKQPTVNHFRNYIPGVTAPCPVDYSPTFDENKIYYNPFGHTAPGNLKITRTVVDQEGNPIKDAVVRVGTFLGSDTYTIIENGVPVIKTVDRWDNYYTHTDISGKFIAIPCTTKYGFIGTPPTTQPFIYGIEISAAGADVINYSYWQVIPNPIVLNKIKDDVSVSGETVASGQTKFYKGRKSLTVKNTTINSGGTVYISSQKHITLWPGFVAHAGSNALMHITPPNCNETALLAPPRENMLLSKDNKDFMDTKEVTLVFEKDFSESSVSVFPNPANSSVTVQLHSNHNASLTQITLYDVYGRTILTTPANSNSNVLNVHHCPPGVYFIKATTATTTCYQKLIIQ